MILRKPVTVRPNKTCFICTKTPRLVSHLRYSTTPDAQKWKNVFDEFANQCNMNSPLDWYNVDLQTIKQHQSTYSILKKEFKCSLYRALCNIYPSVDWCAWKFTHQRVPSGFWKTTSNQRKFFDDLGKIIGVETLDDWYHKLNKKSIIQNGGSAILTLHNTSPITALTYSYPEHNWVPWKFKITKQGYWKSPDNVGRFLTDLSQELGIQTLDDWYRVDRTQLYAFGASGILRRSGFFELLQRQYPNHPWDRRKFLSHRKSQKWLATALRKLFPSEEIMEDYQHPNVFFPETKRPLELDVFVPSRSLAFEYQGEQHYQDIGLFQPSNNYQKRDQLKKSLCAQHGITLVEVPFWWDKTLAGLKNIIQSGTHKPGNPNEAEHSLTSNNVLHQ